MAEEDKITGKKISRDQSRVTAGVTNSSIDIVIPLTVRIPENKSPIIITQFLIVIFTTILFAFSFCVILRNPGNHAVSMVVFGVILFSASLMFAAKFVDMTFANLWVHFFESGANIVIEEDGMFDSRISAKK